VEVLARILVSQIFLISGTMKVLDHRHAGAHGVASASGSV
jgi:hypothetical protein